MFAWKNHSKTSKQDVRNKGHSINLQEDSWPALQTDSSRNRSPQKSHTPPTTKDTLKGNLNISNTMKNESMKTTSCTAATAMYSDVPTHTHTKHKTTVWTFRSNQQETHKQDLSKELIPSFRRSLSADAVKPKCHESKSICRTPPFPTLLDKSAGAPIGDAVFKRNTRSLSLPSVSLIKSAPNVLKISLSKTSKLDHDAFLEEDKNFDSDDSCSNATDTTTVCSYDSSPRSSGPKSPIQNHYFGQFSAIPELTLDEMENIAACLSPKGIHSTSITSHSCGFDTYLSDLDIDENRLANLAEEFRAQHEIDEANALGQSVRQASRLGVISESMEESLYDVIGSGSFDEARDVLYHKCHLIPAVRNLSVSPDANSCHTTIMSEHLNAYVDTISPADTVANRTQKFRVLRGLSNLVVLWVKRVAVERGLSPEHIALTSGALFVAGSHRMGINDPKSDIDTVAVAPWHVRQEDFFGSFVELLRDCPEVRSLTPVTNAFVPLIALVYDNVAIDILFARLPTPCVLPTQDIDSDHILNGVDPASMKSLNAPRVSTLILCLVPRRRVFRSVLRAVRCWARARGIYSSKLGYLGGISWAILVAFVCQMYPSDDSSTVFTRFFQVISEWTWPQPIVLNVLYDADMGFESWDPRSNMYDRTHIMPIITPAYPPMNSSVQVSHATFTVMHEEIWRARYYAELAMSNQVNEKMWAPIFEPSNFFIRYDTYLSLTFSAANPQDMCVWSKFVQSRVRKLVDSLQHVTPIARVHALPRYFPYSSEKSTNFDLIHQCVFIGIEFLPYHGANPPRTISLDDDPQIKLDIDQTVRFFEATDMQQFGLRSNGMQASVELIEWKNLPHFVFENGFHIAFLERKKYHEEIPIFTPPSKNNNYSRNNKFKKKNIKKKTK